MLIEDAHNDPDFCAHAAAQAFPNIGSYIGVPIMLADGRLFGTLCAVDPDARSLTQQQTDLLVVLARLLSTQIERDHELVERQRVTEALSESTARYRSLVQLSPDTIAVLRGTRILYINQAGAQLLGVERPEKLVGRSIMEFADPEHIEPLKALVRLVRDEGQFVPPSEQQLRRLDGTMLPVEVTAIPIVYQGQPAGQVIARDIRRRKQAEADLAQALVVQQQVNAQLERLNKTKSHFVSIVSHEFRTALTGIQGFSEMMRDEEFSVAEMREFAGDINADAQRLNRMITEMLDLDRMESGRMTLHRNQLDLSALLRTVAHWVRPTVPAHPLDLQLTDGLLVLADSDKLTQVIINLISNAVKYSPEGGTITIISGVEDGLAHVRIVDQGVGLPPEALEHIFERYGRVESSATRYVQGTGLGLPISRQIIELHAGRLWAESVLGQGSVFHFTLPLADQALV